MRADAKKHRQDLIEAASRVFAVKGHLAPLQDVLAEAGLGRGTLYRHFPDRASLIMAVITHELDRTLTEVERRAGDPALLKDFVEMQSRCASAHLRAIGSWDEERLQSFIKTIEPTFIRILESVLTSARSLGQIRSDLQVDDMKVAVRMLSAAGEPIGPDDGEESFARALDLVLRGIAA